MTNVTVVIPTYNRGQWLPQTVRTLLAQTHPPLEILIVDDGSTDDTSSICRTFPPDTVRYIHQANAGVSAARNRAIREARGELVAFGDSDDLWEPTKLEVQLAALERSPGADWSISDCHVIDLNDALVPGPQGFRGVFPLFGELDVAPETFFARSLARATLEAGGSRHTVFTGDAFSLCFYGNFSLPSSLLVRRRLLSRVGGFDEAFRVAEETEYVHRLAAAAPVTIVMSPLVRYRVGQPSSLISAGNTTRLIENALTSGERASHLRGPLARAEERAWESGRRRLLLRLAYAHLSLLDTRAARTAIRRAWRTGARLGPRSLALYAASLFPPAWLRALHALKRRLAS